MATKDELLALRKQIDAADDAICAAITKRFAISDRIRELKREARERGEDMPPVDSKREQAIYKRVLEMTPLAHRDTVYSIYERILGGSRGMVETIARGVAIRDNEVLLCRAKGAQTSYLPGGHIEFGETGKAALEREVREELGVVSKAGKFLTVVENSFLQHGKPHSEINLVYELALENDAVASQEEWIEFFWCPLDRLDEVKLLPTSMVEVVTNTRILYNPT